MASKTVVPAACGKPPRRRKPRRLGSTAMIALANCGLVGVTAVFVSTNSVQVTLIAAVAAVLLVGLGVVRS